MEAAEPKESVTTASDWKKKLGPRPIQVPSGNTALVRRVPLAVFWRQGRIPNSLLPIVQRSIRTGPSRANEDEWTDEQLRDMLELFDLVAIEVTVEPKLSPLPKDGEDRDPEKLYVDEVDFDDKAFIYQYAIGAVDDLESFRSESASDVESVPDGNDVDSAPVDPAGDQG